MYISVDVARMQREYGSQYQPSHMRREHCGKRRRASKTVYAFRCVYNWLVSHFQTCLGGRASIVDSVCGSPAVVRQEFARARESNRMNNILRIHHTAAERTLRLSLFVSRRAPMMPHTIALSAFYIIISRVFPRTNGSTQIVRGLHACILFACASSRSRSSGWWAMATIVRGAEVPGTEL